MLPLLTLTALLLPLCLAQTETIHRGPHVLEIALPGLPYSLGSTTRAHGLDIHLPGRRHLSVRYPPSLPKHSENPLDVPYYHHPRAAAAALGKRAPAPGRLFGDSGLPHWTDARQNESVASCGLTSAMQALSYIIPEIVASNLMVEENAPTGGTGPESVLVGMTDWEVQPYVKSAVTIQKASLNSTNMMATDIWWPGALEKAVESLGQNTTYMLSSRAMTMISGLDASFNLTINSGYTAAEGAADKEGTWAILIQCGVTPITLQTDRAVQGALQINHVFTVLKAEETGGVRTLTLHNPHGWDNVISYDEAWPQVYLFSYLTALPTRADFGLGEAVDQGAYVPVPPPEGVDLSTPGPEVPIGDSPVPLPSPISVSLGPTATVEVAPPAKSGDVLPFGEPVSVQTVPNPSTTAPLFTPQANGIGGVPTTSIPIPEVATQSAAPSASEETMSIQTVPNPSPIPSATAVTGQAQEAQQGDEMVSIQTVPNPSSTTPVNPIPTRVSTTEQVLPLDPPAPAPNDNTGADMTRSVAKPRPTSTKATDPTRSRVKTTEEVIPDDAPTGGQMRPEDDTSTNGQARGGQMAGEGEIDAGGAAARPAAGVGADVGQGRGGKVAGDGGGEGGSGRGKAETGGSRESLEEDDEEGDLESEEGGAKGEAVQSGGARKGEIDGASKGKSQGEQGGVKSKEVEAVRGGQTRQGGKGETGETGGEGRVTAPGAELEDENEEASVKTGEGEPGGKTKKGGKAQSGGAEKVTASGDEAGQGGKGDRSGQAGSKTSGGGARTSGGGDTKASSGGSGAPIEADADAGSSKEDEGKVRGGAGTVEGYDEGVQAAGGVRGGGSKSGGGGPGGENKGGKSKSPKGSQGAQDVKQDQDSGEEATQGGGGAGQAGIRGKQANSGEQSLDATADKEAPSDERENSRRGLRIRGRWMTRSIE